MPEAPTSDYEELSFADIVAFFRRNWKLIFGLAGGTGLLTGVLLFFFVPRTWEASVTLVIVPPKFSSELTPSTLTVQAYQTLLESDAVVAEAKQRLMARKVLGSRDALRLGKEIATRIFVSARSEETSLAPMVQAVARGKTPERAAAIANTWVEVFLERTRELVAGTTSSQVQFIQSQYPNARTRLAQMEDERVTAADEFQTAADNAAARWDETITVFRNETADLVADYRPETIAAIEKLRADRSLNVRNAQLESLQKTYRELQEEQARVTALLDQRKLELKASRERLPTTPQYLTLRKAITDDALWREVSGDGSRQPDWEKLRNRTLVTQEPNPAYSSLIESVMRLEIETSALVPRAAQLAGQLEEIADRIKVLESGVRSDEAELDKLRESRDAGLLKLEANRNRQLTALERLRDQELAALSRAHAAKLGQLDRDIDQQKEFFSDLAENYNEALLAVAQRDMEDVRLGAPAVAPDRPRRRGTVWKAALAALCGGLFALSTALVREASP